MSDEGSTVIERDGSAMFFIVTMRSPEAAERGIAMVREMIAENGPKRLRVTFQNVRLSEDEP
jgi:hypothetical protein